MPLICYTPKEFTGGRLAVIEKANEILGAYARQGYDLTLRQLYYQFVARGIIANTDREYKRLGDIISDARMAGLIDWGHIVDRTRNLRANSHWSNPESIVEACGRQFQIDKWARQDNYVEVWIEKDALVGVLEVACQPLDVPYFSCRGYTSQSEMWSAAQRLLGKVREGKKVHIIHLGDHDPSGIDMSRDIDDRLNKFLFHHVTVDIAKSDHKKPGESFEEWKERRLGWLHEETIRRMSEAFTVHRIALNMNQVRQYDPPPNPAKITDSRAQGYIREYGDESWELDALEPSVITDLIQTEVENLRDQDAWDEAVDEETKHRKALSACAKEWGRVLGVLGMENYEN